MDERKRKILKISIICIIVALVIIAIIESFILISLNKKIEQIERDSSIIEERLKNS